MLSIAADKVYFAVVKARAFDVKVEVVEPDPGDNNMGEVLEDYADDLTYAELKSFIEGLNEDEQIDLVALTWLGRGDETGDDWASVRDEAIAARSDHTAEYLLGIPLLGDYLEEGLSKLGYSCDEFELGRL